MNKQSKDAKKAEKKFAPQYILTGQNSNPAKDRFLNLLRESIARGIESSNLTEDLERFDKMTNSLGYYVRKNYEKLGGVNDDSKKVSRLARFVAKNQFDREFTQIVAQNIVKEAKAISKNNMKAYKTKN